MSSHIRRFWKFLRRNETAKGLFLVAIVLLTAIGVWGAIRYALNTEYPVLVVSSGSMLPTLEVGALIVIKGEDPRVIQRGLDCGVPTGPAGPGSIIVFRPDIARPDYLVVHRVRENTTLSGQLAFRTQGDNNNSCDPWGPIPASRIVGVYQYTIPIPGLGSAILAVRGFMYDENTGQPRPQGIAVIVALIVALFAFEVIEPSKKKQPSPPSSPPTPTVQSTPEKQPGPEGPSPVRSRENGLA